LPGLAQRREDIEPNIEHQLGLASEDLGRKIRMTTEARAAYLRFAQSGEASWAGNFRDLSASMTRLATLADNGRIGAGLVDAEIARLRWQWQGTPQGAHGAADAAAQLDELLGAAAAELDCFDRLQLQAVVAVCRRHHSLSDAGRELFNVSRTQRSVVNDADRLRKYLLKFDLSWEKLSA
jgi:transcriptional regulatory protein RtcR